MKNKNRTIKNIIILLSIFAVMLYMNFLTPLYADDYQYQFSWANRTIRIQNISQLVSSIKAHYYVMNGRVVVHALDQFFLMIGKNKFNIINAFGFTMLIYLSAYHIRGTIKKIRWYDIFLIFLSLWYLTPAFGESYLWLTGSCNYLWGILIILSYYTIYTNYFNQIKTVKKFEILFSIIVMITSVIAGCTNENTSVALCCMQIVAILIALEQKRVRPWMIMGVAGNILGGLVILKSPGQMSRLSETSGSLLSLDIWRINIINISGAIFRNLLIFVIIFYVLMVASKKQNIFKEMIDAPETISWGIGAIVSAYVMIVSPQFPDRLWSGIVVLFTIFIGKIILIVLNEYKDVLQIKKKQIKIFLLITAFGWLCGFEPVQYDLQQTYLAFKSRQEEIQRVDKKSDYILYTNPITGSSRYNCYSSNGDISMDKTEWRNEGIAKYYGIRFVVDKKVVEIQNIK